MKSLHFIFIAFLLLLVGCNKVDVPKGTPKCIKKKIQNNLTEDVRDPAAIVYSYEYNGETVYYFSAYCCDVPSMLYDEDCNLICQPDGGITGNGDGNCQDFFTMATNETFIWRDTRDD